ncbi:MAG: hypothetical protein Q8M65_01690, partial [Rhodoglobus sp.]|nr:hypothetical protein [Rhodoglobus sp.]
MPLVLDLGQSACKPVARHCRAKTLQSFSEECEIGIEPSVASPSRLSQNPPNLPNEAKLCRANLVALVLAIVDECVFDEIDLPGGTSDDGEPFIVNPTFGKGHCSCEEFPSENRRRSGREVSAQECIKS